MLPSTSLHTQRRWTSTARQERSWPGTRCCEHGSVTRTRCPLPRVSICSRVDYRDSLCAFAGIEYRVPEWVKEAYVQRYPLRQMWRALEARGEAVEWAKGVGQGGQHEWVALLRQLQEMYENESGVTWT